MLVKLFLNELLSSNKDTQHSCIHGRIFQTWIRRSCSASSPIFTLWASEVLQGKSIFPLQYHYNIEVCKIWNCKQAQLWLILLWLFDPF